MTAPAPHARHILRAWFSGSAVLAHSPRRALATGFRYISSPARTNPAARHRKHGHRSKGRSHQPATWNLGSSAPPPSPHKSAVPTRCRYAWPSSITIFLYTDVSSNQTSPVTPACCSRPSVSLNCPRLAVASGWAYRSTHSAILYPCFKDPSNPHRARSISVLVTISGPSTSLR